MEILVEKFCEKNLNLINLEDSDDFWNMNMLKEEILSSNSYFVVAKYNGKIVRFCGYQYYFR